MTAVSLQVRTLARPPLSEFSAPPSKRKVIGHILTHGAAINHAARYSSRAGQVRILKSQQNVCDDRV